jgi:hypothetical protein
MTAAHAFSSLPIGLKRNKKLTAPRPHAHFPPSDEMVSACRKGLARPEVDTNNLSHVDGFLVSGAGEHYRPVLEIDAIDFGHGETFLMTVFENDD